MLTHLLSLLPGVVARSVCGLRGCLLDLLGGLLSRLLGLLAEGLDRLLHHLLDRLDHAVGLLHELPRGALLGLRPGNEGGRQQSGAESDHPGRQRVALRAAHRLLRRVLDRLGGLLGAVLDGVGGVGGDPADGVGGAGGRVTHAVHGV
ncbi:hypothetical protein CA984_01990 [Streptosporangium minutum]|uniref:Uncharacterized protein n=1 Tax=Streptosporangium minutum TaxID=569862 RepID=A0A243RWY4_9ACTN|nr:hypothetical protein CA984_01990 [Streptosporangium minutum]